MFFNSRAPAVVAGVPPDHHELYHHDVTYRRDTLPVMPASPSGPEARGGTTHFHDLLAYTVALAYPVGDRYVFLETQGEADASGWQARQG